MDIERKAPVCYRHPDRETRLACSNCGKPICAECSHDAAVGQRCPQCAAPEHRTRVVRARDIGRSDWRTAPVSFGIIAVSLLIFLAELAHPNPAGRIEPWFVDFGQINLAIEAGEWWRVFTAGFLHSESILHVGFNMYALYLFGPRVEREAGSVPFAVLYLASMAAGGAAYYLLGPEITPAVGASGAVFGLFGLWLAATYRQRHTAFGSAVFNQLVVLMLINLAIPLFVPSVAWQAHLGGLAAGIVIGYLWSTYASGQPNAVQIRTVIAVAVLALSVGAVLIL